MVLNMNTVYSKRKNLKSKTTNSNGNSNNNNGHNNSSRKISNGNTKKCWAHDLTLLMYTVLCMQQKFSIHSGHSSCIIDLSGQSTSDHCSNVVDCRVFCGRFAIFARWWLLLLMPKLLKCFQFYFSLSSLTLFLKAYVKIVWKWCIFSDEMMRQVFAFLWPNCP